MGDAAIEEQPMPELVKPHATSHSRIRDGAHLRILFWRTT